MFATLSPADPKHFEDELPSISIPAPNLWQLIASLLHQESAPLHLEAKTKVLENIIENLERKPGFKKNMPIIFLNPVFFNSDYLSGTSHVTISLIGFASQT